MYVSLTVFFEDPFWVGVFEVKGNNSYSICRIVFGSEPKDNEIYEYVLKNYSTLPFGEAKTSDDEIPKKAAVKRLKRLAAKETLQKGISTKSQQAIKLQLEMKKEEKSAGLKAKKREAEEIKFKLHIQKQKKKKRGH